MNALTTTSGMSGGASAMIPRNMRDAMEMANMMAKTGFLPKEIQNPGGALFVMEQSMRWNMSPFAVAMETSFIQGKPMFSGKIVGAAVHGSGVLSGRLSYEYAGSGDDRTVTVSGTLRGETEPRTVVVRVKDAKTANKVWATQTDQQLSYHGNRVWARRHAPEVMLGVYSPEEFDPEQQAPRDVPNLAAAPGSMREVAGQVTGRTIVAPEPSEMTLPLLGPDGTLHQIGGKPGLPAAIRWVSIARKAVSKMEDAAALRAWRAAMGEHFAAVFEREPEAVEEIEREINDRLDAMDPADTEAEAEGV